MSEVRLSDWEREWAGYVAAKRYEANIGKPDAHYYRRELMQDDLIADTAAIVCELAVAKRLNRYWDGSFWKAREHNGYSDRADVGQNTEVRRIRERSNRVTVRAKDVSNNRIIVCAYPYPDEFVLVDVIGWGWAADLWEQGQPAHFDDSGTTMLVVQECLNPL